MANQMLATAPRDPCLGSHGPPRTVPQLHWYTYCPKYCVPATSHRAGWWLWLPLPHKMKVDIKSSWATWKLCDSPRHGGNWTPILSPLVCRPCLEPLTNTASDDPSEIATRQIVRGPSWANFALRFCSRFTLSQLLSGIRMGITSSLLGHRSARSTARSGGVFNLRE